MSSKSNLLEEKRRRLQELKERNRKKAEKKRLERLAKERKRNNIAGTTEEVNDELEAKAKPEGQEAGFKEESTSGLQVANFVNVLNLPGKQNTYKYDQNIGVTKEDIALLKILQQEEEVPTFDIKNDEDEESDDEEDDDPKKIKVKRVPADEAKKLMESKPFRKFLRRGSAHLDKAFDDTYTLIEDVLQNENPEVAQDVRERITESRYDFACEAVQEDHMVAMVEWCRTNAEQFLVVYNAKTPEENMGKVVVWSLENKGTEIAVLLSTVKVNRAIFHPTDENRVYGGLSSGQVVLWDIREKAKPIIKTKPSLTNHNLPVYCLALVNDGRRDMVLSVSYEGRICFWNSETLDEPFITEDLKFKLEKGRPDRDGDESPLAPMTCTVTEARSDRETKIFLGTYDRIIQAYKIPDFINQNNEKFVNTFKGHEAPICSLSYKSNPTNKNLDGLLISGSFDFSIKLWKPERSDSALHSLDVHEDYVTSVDWNPAHPAMFASVDCAGKICVWDLIEDRDYPVYIARTTPASCLKWHPDGVKLIIGTIKGEVQIWNLKKRFLKVIDEQRKELEFFVGGGGADQVLGL